MSYLARFAPLRAVRDLRQFLAQRQPYELGFLALALVMTGLLIGGFVKDSRVERPYKRDIIYVQSWPLDRSLAQIRAQAKVDQVKIDADKAALLARQEKRKAEFKRLDDKLKSWGI